MFAEKVTVKEKLSLFILEGVEILKDFFYLL